MATITPKINGQYLSELNSYAYMFEPFLVDALGDTRGTVENEFLPNLSIDLTPWNNQNGIPETTIIDFGKYDLIQGVPIEIDLMKLVLQHADLKTFSNGSVDDISNDWYSLITQYRYQFQFRQTSNQLVLDRYFTTNVGGIWRENNWPSYTDKLWLIQDSSAQLTYTISNFPQIPGLYTEIEQSVRSIGTKYRVEIVVEQLTGALTVELGLKYQSNSDPDKYTIYAAGSYSFDLEVIGDVDAKHVVIAPQANTTVTTKITSCSVVRVGVTDSYFKTAILGQRTFQQYEPALEYSTLPTTEFDLYGVDLLDLKARWKGFPSIEFAWKNPNQVNIVPNIVITNLVGQRYPFGWLIWKSRFGGWMFWGFELSTIKESGSYVGDVEVGMFEANDSGNPYVEADYTERQSSRTISLKSLDVEMNELKAVAGIASSPVIYYMDRDSGSRLELVKLTSVSADIDQRSDGGDFAVSVKSISKQSQKIR